jgi:hypothetical protein
MKPWKQTAAVIVVALAFATTACNGGSSPRVATLNGGGDTNSSSSDTGGGDGGDNGDVRTAFQDALLDYSRCMRDHGIDMPDPTFDGDGHGGVAVISGATGGDGKLPDPNSQTFKDAETACKPIMDRAQQNAPKPSAEEQAKMRDGALKFAQCMRDKGFDVPDPTFDENGGMSVHFEGAASASDSGPSTNGGPAGAGPMDDPGFQQAADECQQQSGGGPRVVAGTGPATSGAGK